MVAGTLDKASNYTDLQGLSELRRKARDNSPEALQAVAKQFEALFLQIVLKSMRDANLGDGLFENDQSELYTDLYDKQLSLTLSEGKGIGLAETLVRQLQTTLEHTQQPGTSESSSNGFPVPPRSSFTAAVPYVASPETEAVPESVVKSKDLPSPTTFDSAEEFVTALWPHASKAGKDLGVDPRALLAQAALETGWGKSVIRQPDGSSSHNLFNIKADRRWDGDRVQKSTLEYREGVAVQERAQFRAYGSYAESFDDYVAFLKSSPRYSDALKQVEDPSGFIDSLHKAGYATDPHYSQKVTRILKSDTFNEPDKG